MSILYAGVAICYHMCSSLLLMLFSLVVCLRHAFKLKDYTFKMYC